MVENDQSIEIDVPPEEVFDFIADPTNHLKFTPSLTDVSNVTENDVGKEGEYAFNMMGTSLEGGFADVAFDRPTKRSYDLTGDIEGNVTWTIQEANGGSKVRYESDIEFPGPDVLSSLTKPIERRMSRNEIQSTLENLQVFLEENED